LYTGRTFNDFNLKIFASAWRHNRQL
jgi:hypothetical protein